MITALACLATFVVAFALGAGYGVWLDNTQRVKPIELGVGKTIIATTSDPTEICLVDPYRKTERLPVGEFRKVHLSTSEVGVLLARIRIVSPAGAYVFRDAYDSAVEAAWKKTRDASD